MYINVCVSNSPLFVYYCISLLYLCFANKYSLSLFLPLYWLKIANVFTPFVTPLIKMTLFKLQRKLQIQKAESLAKPTVNIFVILACVVLTKCKRLSCVTDRWTDTRATANTKHLHSKPHSPYMPKSCKKNLKSC